MKKYIMLFGFMLLTLVGCGKYTITDAINDFQKKVENSKSYKLSGTMEISNGEEIFNYSLETYYLKDDYYKVVLINQTNNHEQVILKNKEGLYVVTPNLNKSFKFDSVWPENSSQAYLLMNLVNDIKSDSETTLEEKENVYIIKSKVNYPNNEELEYQKIYFDKKMNIEKVEVYDNENVIKIKVNFKDVNLKAKLSDDDFELDDLITEEKDNNTEESGLNVDNNEKEDISSDNSDNNSNNENELCDENTCADKEINTSTLESIIYPLYVPANTHLSSSETVNTETGDRVILTFSGDKNFVIVEEKTMASNEFEIIPVFGDPHLLDDSLAALSSNSISWHANNISYYLVGSDLSTSEMVNIASSLGNSTTVISTK